MFAGPDVQSGRQLCSGVSTGIRISHLNSPPVRWGNLSLFQLSKYNVKSQGIPSFKITHFYFLFIETKYVHFCVLPQVCICPHAIELESDAIARDP